MVVERDDGFVSVDTIEYLGGLDARDEWAVSRATGRVLDVGAGAGRAALALQERGQQVTALEVSPGAAQACRARGVRDVYLGTPQRAAADGMAGAFDSALLLGNNIGLLGSREAAGRSSTPSARSCAPAASSSARPLTHTRPASACTWIITTETVGGAACPGTLPSAFGMRTSPATGSTG